ncbi:MAG: DUF4974 domain-containing protein [Chitinophagaceae bacterium]
MISKSGYLFLFGLLISCKNEEGTGNQGHDQVVADTALPPAADSLYQSSLKFVAPDFVIPIMKAARKKQADTANDIYSKASYHMPGFKENFSSLVAENGTIYSLALYNKTKVMLNSSSQLVFRPGIGNYLLLFGEGYFEIAEDATIIEVNYEAKIKASAGSVIAITAYDKSTGHVALIKGNITVTIDKTSKRLNTPGYELVFNYEAKKITQRSCHTDDMLAWKNNQFKYTHIDYKALLNRICRWYDKELIFPDSVPNHYGMFEGNYKEPLITIIDRINNAYPKIHCTIEDDKIIVTKKPH